MRLIHLADLHLGFVAHPERIARGGGSQREADVAATFTIAVDRIIALAPDVIVIAGDVFHLCKPAVRTTLFAVEEFSRLARLLPETIIVVAAGNHDLSADTENPCILNLFSAFGIHVATRQAQRLYFADRNLSILSVPDAPGVGRPALEPDPRATTNVMVLHGEVQGMLPSWVLKRTNPAAEITNDELGAEKWDYVALGHHHVHTQLAPNVAYSGSIDFTSTSVWKEIDTPKGFIERDLATGVSTFHVLPPSRVFVDLSMIDAYGMTPADVDTAIARALDGVDGGIDNKVVRLVVENIDILSQRALDRKAIGKYKANAMALSLDLRKPDAQPFEVWLNTVPGAYDQDAEQRALSVEMAEWWGDDAPLPDTVSDFAEFNANVKRIMLGDGRSLPSMLDPYGLDDVAEDVPDVPSRKSAWSLDTPTIHAVPSFSLEDSRMNNAAQTVNERPVMVTTEHRGVFFGYATITNGETIELKRARNCSYWSADVRGFMGLASNGPSRGCRIGPQADIELRAITSVVEVTPEAAAKWEAAPWG